MQYKNITKILIDRRKLDTLLRLGCQESIIWEYIKTGEIQYTGDALIDDNLESLIDVRAFKNWGGNHNPTGKNQYTKHNVANASKCYQVLPNATITKNQESGQVDHQVDQAVDLGQDIGQDIGQVGDIDIDRDIYNNNIYNINTKEKESIIKEKENPTSNSGFDHGTITENAEQKNARQEVSQDSDKELIRKTIKNWNYLAEQYGFQNIQTINHTRLSKLKNRIKQSGGFKEFWDILQSAIDDSKFLRYGHDSWKCNFDFVLQESSFLKIMEHQYR